MPANASADLFAFDARSAAIDSVHAQTAIYTSRHVVDGLLDRVGWPRDCGRLLDPSCGDGAFLIAALERLKVRPNDLASVSRVRGYEIHPGAVADARENVETWLMARDWSFRLAQRAAADMVIEADFLVDFPEHESYDLILGNPPYLRYQFVPQYFQDLYRDRLPSFTHGDLLHGFLFKCTQMLTPDGIIAMVTADRWAFNASCGELRQRVGELVGIDHIARLDCDTSFYRPKRRISGSLPRVHPIEVVLRPKAFAPRALTADPVMLDGEVAATGRTLSDLAEIRLGPWFSKPGTFTVPAALAAELQSEPFTGARFVPAVEAKSRDIDWEAGVMRSEPTSYAILTEKDTAPTGSVARHLKSTAGMHSERAKRPEWWLPPEFARPQDIARAKLVVPIISKELRAVRVPSGMLAVHHQVVVIFPKPGTSMEEILAVLARPESQAYWRSASKPIEGGYYQTGAGVIRNLPV